MGDFDEIFGGGFDAEEEAAAAANEQKDYSPLEPGWYKCVIEAPKDGQMIRDSKAGGKYLKLVFRVAPGEPHENRIVFCNINLKVVPKNGSSEAASKAAKAEQIGRRELGKLCVSAGKPMAKDSAELVDCLVAVRVAVGKNASGDPENEVKDFKAVDGDPLPAVPAGTPAPAAKPIPAPAAPAATTGTTGKLPWQR